MPTLAVTDVDVASVALDDDLVADGEAASRQHDLLDAELTCFAERQAGAGIEIGDVGAPAGDHHRCFGIAALREPIVDEPLPHVTADDHAIAPHVLLQRFFRVSVSQLVERITFPGFSLPEVVVQLDCHPSMDEAAERAAGLQLR